MLGQGRGCLQRVLVQRRRGLRLLTHVLLRRDVALPAVRLGGRPESEAVRRGAQVGLGSVDCVVPLGGLRVQRALLDERFAFVPERYKLI